jgi:hypothetical protein
VHATAAARATKSVAEVLRRDNVRCALWARTPEQASARRAVGEGVKFWDGSYNSIYKALGLLLSERSRILERNDQRGR